MRKKANNIFSVMKETMIVHCLLVLSITAYSYAVSGGKPVISSFQHEAMPYKERLAGVNPTLEVLPFQFPEIMSVTYSPEGSSSETFIGQASIIAANMTITAASIFWNIGSDTMMNETEIKLYGGSLSKGPTASTRASIGDPTAFAVKNIYIHPGFAFYPTSQIFEKDIALVVPETNFTLKSADPGPYLRTIALSSKKFNRTNSVDGRTKGFTPSWGKVGDGSGKVSTAEVTVMNVIEYPFAKHTDCVLAYQSATGGSGSEIKSSPYSVTTSSLCMNTTQGKSICQEDGGAAVRVVQAQVPYIYGIASKIMTDTCPSTRPDLYTRLSYFVTWIQSKGGPKAL